MEVKPIETISIVGVGSMGAQIGLRCASHRYTVWLVDISERVLEQASQGHMAELERRVEEQQINADDKEAILKRLHYTIDLKKGTSQADLVIEAIPERLEAKREIFTQLDQVCPGQTILATNSSSIRISLIEDATHRLDRVLNTHFYQGVEKVTMVELMRGTTTSDETIERVQQFAYGIEMIPLLVRKESTGFIFNRVWRAIKKECLQVVDAGIASYEDVDRAWIIHFTGQLIGPFGLMDKIGLDVIRDIEMVYYHESGDESDAPVKLLLDKIEKGELGVKTGKGFYRYPNPAFQNPSWLRGI